MLLEIDDETSHCKLESFMLLQAEMKTHSYIHPDSFYIAPIQYLELEIGFQFFSCILNL